MMKRALCRSIARFYFCKFLTALLLLTFFYVSYKTIESLNNSSALPNLSPWSFMAIADKSDNTIDIDDNNPSKVELSTNSIGNAEYLKSCPICLGTTICDNIDIGALKISNQPIKQGNSVTYKGTWHSSGKVIVKFTNQDYVKRYKQFICPNITGTNDCPTLKSRILVRSQLFTVNAIRDIYRLSLLQRSDIPAIICATEKLIAHLKIMYDLDGNGKTSDTELLMLHTTLATNPEALVHLFLAKSSINLPIPYFYGVCGQALVIEGSMTPLDEYLHESFSVRANLAVQILQIVEDFLEEDSDWLFLFSNFTFKNLAVKEDGDVVLTDVTNLAIIDKSLTSSHNEVSSREKLCNEACYRQYTSDLYHSPNDNRACSRISHISHMMYAIVCQNILSNLEEHKNLFAANTPKAGLLHTIPEKDKQILEDLLQECVKETSAGSRIQAAEELKDMLGEYVSDDEDAAVNNGENEESSEDNNEH